MDIFTTYLTRVVPVPIKPANLKVKALLKDAGAGKLKEDLDHLENHDYYFFEQELLDKPEKDKENKQSNQEGASHKEKNKKNQCEEASPNHTNDSDLKPNDDNGIVVDKDGTNHLDLYV